MRKEQQKNLDRFFDNIEGTLDDNPDRVKKDVMSYVKQCKDYQKQYKEKIQHTKKDSDEEYKYDNPLPQSDDETEVL